MERIYWGARVPAVQVRVQAGAKVQDVVEALRPYDLTLQNYASVREQQIGGFTQVSAHGTGAALPPVDEQVVALRVVAPGLGQPVELARGKDVAFEWAKLGLGSMGVVTEVILQCVDAHRLLEETTVTDRRTVARKHQKCALCSAVLPVFCGFSLSETRTIVLNIRNFFICAGTTGALPHVFALHALANQAAVSDWVSQDLHFAGSVWRCLDQRSCVLSGLYVLVASMAGVCSRRFHVWL